MFSLQILGQLGTGSQKSHALESLVTDAREWCSSHPHPVLVPQHPCLPSPGGHLRLTINAYLQAPGAFRKKNRSDNKNCG